MNSQELNNFYEAYLDVYTDLDEERAEGVKPYQPRKRRPLDPEKALSGEKGDGSGYGADEKFKKPDDKIKKPGTEVPAPKKGGYGRIFSNIPYGIGAHANRNRSRNSTVRGMDPGAPRSEKIAPQDKKKASKEIVRKEGYDLYDVILSHLLDEGYADTQEAAEAIMVNMSEDWRESIVEEVLEEGEKPFPYENVKAKQVALRDKGSAGLDPRMKMGMAVRRAKEADKKGGSQQDAGKGWYHGK